MLERVERRRGRLVQLGLEAVERRHDREARLDRVHSLAGLADVRGRAGDVNVEPEDADLRDADRGGEGLRDHGGVDRRAGKHALERTVAGALLLDDGLQLYGGEWREAEPSQATH